MTETKRPPIAVSERLFRAVVAASTLAVAGFLAYAVTAWRPHEDEVLELFAGRGSFPDLADTIFHRAARRSISRSPGSSSTSAAA